MLPGFPYSEAGYFLEVGLLSHEAIVTFKYNQNRRVQTPSSEYVAIHSEIGYFLQFGLLSLVIIIP